MKFRNYRNPYTNDNRIYSNKDLYNMSLGEFIKRKQEVLGQYRVLGVPTEKELQDSDNVVHVEAYTREDGTEVKAHYRSKPGGSISKEKMDTQTTNDKGGLTGSAANIQEKELKKEDLQKDIPKMTKSAELQENTIKNMPISVVKLNPEQEYYRIAFELKKANETGEIPEWIKEHNDIRTLDKVGNEDNRNALKEKIIKGAKDNNDIETLNNLDKVYVITAKPDSKLAQKVINSSYFKQEIDKRITKIESGEYEKTSFSVAFPDTDFSTHNAIGRCDVHNVKVEFNGDISATIIDYYDFDKKSNNPIVKNGYIQQQNGHLNNYALMVPIRIKVKK